MFKFQNFKLQDAKCKQTFEFAKCYEFALVRLVVRLFVILFRGNNLNKYLFSTFVMLCFNGQNFKLAVSVCKNKIYIWLIFKKMSPSLEYY